jgi:hypothetical protein
MVKDLDVRTAETEDAFKAFLQSRRLQVSELRAESAIGAWIEFYKAQRVDDVDEGMDWLWFQFGTYDWGQGPSFQLDLTRQFILQDETDDDAIWQMYLVLHFPPDASLGDGMETCEEPADADEFHAALLAHPPSTLVAELIPERVELFLENAG